jgi:hypothetical protein
MSKLHNIRLIIVSGMLAVFAMASLGPQEARADLDRLKRQADDAKEDIQREKADAKGDVKREKKDAKGDVKREKKDAKGDVKRDIRH